MDTDHSPMWTRNETSCPPTQPHSFVAETIGHLQRIRASCVDTTICLWRSAISIELGEGECAAAIGYNRKLQELHVGLLQDLQPMEGLTILAQLTREDEELDGVPLDTVTTGTSTPIITLPIQEVCIERLSLTRGRLVVKKGVPYVFRSPLFVSALIHADIELSLTSADSGRAIHLLATGHGSHILLVDTDATAKTRVPLIRKLTATIEYGGSIRTEGISRLITRSASLHVTGKGSLFDVPLYALNDLSITPLCPDRTSTVMGILRAPACMYTEGSLYEVPPPMLVAGMSYASVEEYFAAILLRLFPGGRTRAS